MHAVKVLQGFQEELRGKEEGWRENADVTSRLRTVRLPPSGQASSRVKSLLEVFSAGREKKERDSVVSSRAELPPVREVNTTEFCRCEITLWFFAMSPLTLEIPTALFTSQSPD